MRYKVYAFFQEEQRKGFVVSHLMEKEFDDNDEMNQKVMTFLSSYNHRYCHGLIFHVDETP